MQKHDVEDEALSLDDLAARFCATNKSFKEFRDPGSVLRAARHMVVSNYFSSMPTSFVSPYNEPVFVVSTTLDFLLVTRGYRGFNHTYCPSLSDLVLYLKVLLSTR
jgi:hypothetical protein